MTKWDFVLVLDKVMAPFWPWLFVALLILLLPSPIARARQNRRAFRLFNRNPKPIKCPKNTPHSNH